MHDFNNSDPQREFDLIPANTIVTLHEFRHGIRTPFSG